MSVMNRRNAVFGWIAWTITKEALRSKSRHVVHKNDGTSTRRKVVVPAAIAAAVGGALLFWKRQQSNGDGTADH
jgi:hypothetical protein